MSESWQCLCSSMQLSLSKFSPCYARKTCQCKDSMDEIIYCQRPWQCLCFSIENSIDFSLQVFSLLCQITFPNAILCICEKSFKVKATTTSDLLLWERLIKLEPVKPVKSKLNIANTSRHKIPLCFLLCEIQGRKKGVMRGKTS